MVLAGRDVALRVVCGRGLTWYWVRQLGFEAGDAPVLEAEVGGGGLEPLVAGPVVCGT